MAEKDVGVLPTEAKESVILTQAPARLESTQAPPADSRRESPTASPSLPTSRPSPKPSVENAPPVLAVLADQVTTPESAARQTSPTPWVPLTAAADQLLGPLSGSWAGDVASLEALGEPKAAPPQRPGPQPSVEEFDEKLFAVHATRILPKDGVLKAGIGNWHGRDFEPPSFRPTVHFALGEMVQSHGRYEADQPYAVVAPVRSLKPQLANLSPHDTFIVGDLKIPKDATLVVPEGTDLKDFPKELKVSTYKKDEKLRQAVDRVIKDEGGWKIEMERGGVRNGDTAKIAGEEINSTSFFRSLLDSMPGVSYGSHVYSEEGQAQRMGTIEQCVNLTIKAARQGFLEPATVKFYNALWDHNEKKLEQGLPDHVKSNPQSRRALEEKKRQIAGWREVSRFNEQLMTREGKRLVLSDQQFAAIGAVKNQPTLLQSTLRQADVGSVNDSEPLSISTASEAMMGMSPREFQEFKAGHPSVFKGVNMPKLEATYAVRRWTLIGSERAKKEKLDVMLSEAVKPETGLQRLKSLLFNQVKKVDFDPVEALEGSLDEKSPSLPVALEILRLPALREQQAEKGVHFHDGGPHNLQEVLGAHPRTKAAFLPPEPLSSNPKDPAARLVQGLEFSSDFDTSNLTSFSNAESLISRRAHRHELGQIYMQDIRRPLTQRKGQESYYRDFADLQQERFPNQEALWDKLGLGKEFRDHFPAGEAMWKSDRSLLQIMNHLEKAKSGS